MNQNAVFDPMAIDAGLQPATVSGARRWAEWMALAAIGYLAVTSMTAFVVVKPEYGAALAALMLPFAGGHVWRALGRSVYVRALGLFTAFVLLQTLYLHGADGSEVSLQELAEAASKPVKLGLGGIVIGAWLSLRPRMIGVLLKLMLAGLVVQALVSLAGTPLLPLLTGRTRLDFGYPENLGGAFAAIGVLAMMLMALDTGLHKHRPSARVGLGLMASGALFLLACLVLAGPRGAWLAAGVTIPLVAGLYLRNGGWRAWNRRLPAARLFGALATVFVAVAVVTVVRATASDRLDGAAEISDAVLSGSFNDIPMSSVGIRLHLLVYGWNLFLERPLMGHGLGAISHLVEVSNIKVGGYVPTHMHDSYLQTLVGTGLVGSGLLLWGLWAVGRRVYTGFRLRMVDTATFWMLLGSAAILAVVNLFDCLTWHLSYSRVPMELLLGCALAISLRVDAVRTLYWNDAKPQPHA